MSFGVRINGEGSFGITAVLALEIADAHPVHGLKMRVHCCLEKKKKEKKDPVVRNTSPGQNTVANGLTDRRTMIKRTNK